MLFVSQKGRSRAFVTATLLLARRVARAHGMSEMRSFFLFSYEFSDIRPVQSCFSEITPISLYLSFILSCKGQLLLSAILPSYGQIVVLPHSTAIMLRMSMLKDVHMSRLFSEDIAAALPDDTYSDCARHSQCQQRASLPDQEPTSSSVHPATEIGESLASFYEDTTPIEEIAPDGKSAIDGSVIRGELLPPLTHKSIKSLPDYENVDMPTPAEPEKAVTSQPGLALNEETMLARHTSMPPRGPPPKPVEGRDAWLCAAGGFICLFVSFGWVNCVGLFQSYYEANQLREYSPGQVAWITSLEIFLMFFLGIFFGKLYDSYGPRWLLLIGTVFHVLGLMMASFCTQYYQFLLSQGICSSIGASAIFYGAVGAASPWFDKNQTLAVGLVASGSSVGGVIFPIMIKILLPEIGFAWTMRSAAFLILGLLVFANVTVKNRLPPAPKSGSITVLFLPFKDKLWIVSTIGAFFFSFGLFPVYNFLVTEAVSSDMDQSLAIYCLVVLNALSLPGRVLPNALADRIGRYNTMILMSLLASLCVLVIWLPGRNSDAGIIAFSAAFGFSSGAYVSLAPALMLQISERKVAGLNIGMMYAMASFAALVGSPLGGSIIDSWGGRYQGIMMFCGFMEMVGVLFFLLARWMQAGLAIKKV